MKKRFTLIVLTAFLALSLVACGGDENVTTQENDSSAVVTTDFTVIQTEEVVTPERERSELLPGTHKVSLRDIYVDIPKYNVIGKGYTEIFMDGETKYITFSCMKDDVAADAKEAFDVVYPKFKINIANQHGIHGEDFTTQELVEINGIEAYKVSGIVDGGVIVIKDCYFYGYSFIYDGLPCGIFGVVSDWDQPEEEIESVTAIVDAMMESVRSEQ